MAVGITCAGLAGACSSEVEDCAATHTCIETGESGAPGSGGTAALGPAGGGGGSGRAGATAAGGMDPPEGSGGRTGHAGGSHARGSDDGGAGAENTDVRHGDPVGTDDGGAEPAGGRAGSGHAGSGHASGGHAGGADPATAGEGGAAGDVGSSCGDGGCTCSAASCDGWCQGATCVAFDTIAVNQATFPATRGIAVQGANVYWTSSSSSDPNADKYRVQRRVDGHAVETLLSNQAHALGPLQLGAERLFALNTQTGNLWSTELDGSNPRTDQWTVPEFRYRAGRIYWPEIVTFRFRELHIKSQSETDPSDVVDEVSTVGDATAEFADIAFAGTQFAYALNMASPESEVGQYGIWLFNGSASAIFPLKNGRLEELECDSGDNYYWRVRASATGGADLLMQNDGASGVTAIATGVDVTDFAVSEPSAGGAFVYYAYTDPAAQTSGVRLYDTVSAETYDIVTGDQAGSLATDATHLYFFEASGHRLVRLPLPHVVLGLR